MRCPLLEMESFCDSLFCSVHHTHDILNGSEMELSVSKEEKRESQNIELNFQKGTAHRVPPQIIECAGEKTNPSDL